MAILNFEKWTIFLNLFYLKILIDTPQNTVCARQLCTSFKK